MTTQFQPPVLVPLPFRRWTATCDNVPNLSVTTLIAQGQQVGGIRPGTITFANLPLRKWNQTPDLVPNLLIFTLKVPQPFSLSDYPSPQRLRALAAVDQPPNMAVLGIPTLPPPPTPHLNEQSFRLSVNAVSDAPNTLATVLQTVPAFIPGGIILGQAFKTNVSPQIDPPNILVTTLASTPVKPFAQTDWPRVVSPGFVGVPAVEWPFTSTPQIKPFALTDFTMTPRAKPLNEITFHRAANVTLVVAPLPFNAYDWPTPFKAKFAFDVQPPPNTTIPMTQPTILPASAEYRTSNVPSWVAKTSDIPNLLTGSLPLPNPQPQPLEPQTQVYGRWINPVDPVTNQVSLGFVLPPAPFFQSDWPPPFKTRVQLIDQPANLSTLSFVNVKPFAQTDWPQPFAKGFSVDLPPPNLLNSLQFVAPPKPFAELNWPKIYRTSLTGHSDDWPNIALSVAQPNPQPFNQTDWPRSFPSVWAVWVDSLADSPLVTVSPGPPGPPPQPGSGGGREGGMLILQPKKQGEILNLEFPFISILASGETITGASFVVSVYSGIDPSPQSLAFGLPTLAGTSIFQVVTGGVVGCTYELLCVATTSLARRPEISSYYVIEPDLS